MNKNRLISLFGVACFAVALCGCGDSSAPAGDPSAAATPKTSEMPADTGTNYMEGANAPAGRGGAKVVTQVPTSGEIPPGGLVITPPNPDDPRYKPAPGMAGGG